MLNISLKRINDNIDLNKYNSFRATNKKSVSKVLLRLMIILLIGAFFAMFLPWTQNIRANGSVTTMSPDDRPQSVQATIGGKIEKWYVNEGTVVSKGDTIMRISEVKEDYMDPAILDNTNNQIIAKAESSKAYASKANNLNQQLGNQLGRIQNLYDEGLKSLTDLEAKRLSIQEAQAKVVSIENKVNSNKNELINLQSNIDNPIIISHHQSTAR